MHRVQTTNPPEPSHSLLYPALALWIITLVVYAPTLAYPFLTMDDPGYVTANPHVRSGLSWENVCWAFTSLHGGISYWHPITWLSHQLDCHIFGLNAGPHHATNLLWHALNGFLVFVLGLRLDLGRTKAGILAIIFAIHPLHVESVAWIAERKDLLAGACYLGSLILYTGYVRSIDRSKYRISLVLAWLAMMSKPTAVTLPIALGLLRLHLSRAEHRHGENPCSPRVLTSELLPFVALAAVTSTLTLLGQRDLGAIASTTAVPFAVRLDEAWLAIAAYLGRFVYPVGLSPAYGTDPAAAINAMPALGFLAASTALLWRLRHRSPVAWFGWLFFLVLLLPTLGLIRAGPQSSADRYMYLPLVGLTLILIEAGSALLARVPTGILRIPAVSLPLIALAFLCRFQVTHWRDSVAVFSRSVQIQPNHWFAQLGLGTAWVAAGNHDAALPHLNRALELPGNAAEAHRMLGVCYAGKRMFGEAVRHTEQAFALRPSHHTALTLAHLYSGAEDPSLRDGTRALAYARAVAAALPRPDGAAWLILAAAHEAAGETEMARACLDKAAIEGSKAKDPSLVETAISRRRILDHQNPILPQAPAGSG